MTLAPADAAFSACGRYRWWLWRQWHRQRPLLLFVGLNPSRADGARDDATLRRLVGFARQWDYGALLVLNLFACISPSPALLRRAADPVGAETDAWLQLALTGRITAAGGSIVGVSGRHPEDAHAMWSGRPPVVAHCLCAGFRQCGSFAGVCAVGCDL